MYYFFASLLEMLLLFFYSIIYMTKPSDTLSRGDLDDIRHRRKPDNNGNDWKYRGGRGESRFYMGG